MISIEGLKIENVEVVGWRAALRGMRNAGESWDRSDTDHHAPDLTTAAMPQWRRLLRPPPPLIGPLDMALAKKLIKAGYMDDSAIEGNRGENKFLRDITVYYDLTGPILLWSEFDTYKVDTVRNSCSTMYKLGTRSLTAADFVGGVVRADTLTELNVLGAQFREASGVNKVELLALMKRILPSGYLQKATIKWNYETALKAYFERRNHRMPEWSAPGGICEFLINLPYMREFADATGRL